MIAVFSSITPREILNIIHSGASALIFSSSVSFVSFLFGVSCPSFAMLIILFVYIVGVGCLVNLWNLRLLYLYIPDTNLIHSEKNNIIQIKPDAFVGSSYTIRSGKNTKTKHTFTNTCISQIKELHKFRQGQQWSYSETGTLPGCLYCAYALLPVQVWFISLQAAHAAAKTKIEKLFIRSVLGKIYNSCYIYLFYLYIDVYLNLYLIISCSIPPLLELFGTAQSRFVLYIIELSSGVGMCGTFYRSMNH